MGYYSATETKCTITTWNSMSKLQKCNVKEARHLKKYVHIILQSRKKF